MQRQRIFPALHNLMEEEFDLSVNDLPEDEAQMSTQEEVAPDVSE